MFPLPSPIPRVTLILTNGQAICTGPGGENPYFILSINIKVYIRPVQNPKLYLQIKSSVKIMQVLVKLRLRSLCGH